MLQVLHRCRAVACSGVKSHSHSTERQTVSQSVSQSVKQAGKRSQSQYVGRSTQCRHPSSACNVVFVVNGVELLEPWRESILTGESTRYMFCFVFLYCCTCVLILAVQFLNPHSQQTHTQNTTDGSWSGSEILLCLGLCHSACPSNAGRVCPSFKLCGATL